MAAYEKELKLEATELRLGLPGTGDGDGRGIKRVLKGLDDKFGIRVSQVVDEQDITPPTKSQIVGWPPIRSYRKNNFLSKKNESDGPAVYVKVSMDGAPYLRKIDLKNYSGYPDLLKALENMFKLTIGEYSEREGYKGSEFVPTYEDKDGDLMLAGDVPWEMFMTSCKKLRIMKGSEAKGLGCGI